MNKLHHSDFIANLKNDLTKAKKSFLIIWPYITMTAVDELLSNLPPAPLEKTVITLPFGLEYLTGDVELAALQKLENSGFSLLSLNQLHSKMYVITRLLTSVPPILPVEAGDWPWAAILK